MTGILHDLNHQDYPHDFRAGKPADITIEPSPQRFDEYDEQLQEDVFLGKIARRPMETHGDPETGDHNGHNGHGEKTGDPTRM